MGEKYQGVLPQTTHEACLHAAAAAAGGGSCRRLPLAHS
jgi:hypothetical protein